MTSRKFSAKLSSLPDTLALVREFEPVGLRNALDRARHRRVVAVGAGGSHVSAAYLARCRQTLGHAATVVQTPMELVLDVYDLDDTEVWLFSASANNADAAAAARAALDRGCAAFVLCTCNPDGVVARWVVDSGCEICVFPVADRKDGYLATHSLIATIASLLVAAECLGGIEFEAALDELDRVLARSLATEARADRMRTVADLSADSTIIAIFDPRLFPLRSLIETSIWEAAICPVQVTDMRNFSHGRHAWLHHYGDRSWVFTATGNLSGSSWEAIRSVLPSHVPVIVADYGDCGRVETARALIDGLGWIEAMGASVGIDPGKPGTGEFAHLMYEDESLDLLAIQLSPPVRQKLAAAVRMGIQAPDVMLTASAWRRHFDGLCDVAIGGLVLDYDGTMVTTKGRFDPPDPAIIAELIRLHDQGLVVAFASGRGKSLGSALRSVLPSAMAAETIIGYYNGGHIRMASVDINTPGERPEPDPSIAEAAGWIEAQPNLLRASELDFQEIQVAVRKSDLLRPESFAHDLSVCPAVAEGRITIVSSAHSYDLIPSTSSKLRVVNAVAERVGTHRAVLSMGDSGAPMGNDHNLILGPHGISVGTICGDPAGCWSLFGTITTGPTALLRVLQAMLPSEGGEIRLDRAALNLDARTPHLYRP